MKNASRFGKALLWYRQFCIALSKKNQKWGKLAPGLSLQKSGRYLVRTSKGKKTGQIRRHILLHIIINCWNHKCKQWFAHHNLLNSVGRQQQDERSSLDKTGNTLMIDWVTWEKFSSYSWYYFPSFVEMQIQMLRLLGKAREIEFIKLPVTLQCNVFGVVLRIIFFGRQS